MTDSRPAIVARGLSKRFGGIDVLSRISFELPAGSKTALLGPNAAGKSTLLGLLSTLLTPSGGEAAIGGRLVSANEPELRRQIGVLTHQQMLYEQLSPLQNLEFFGRLYEVPAAGERIEELLRAINLWQRRHEPAAGLSRGFHQRLALARAILHRPAVLLLDEPESGLDAEGVALLDGILAAPDTTVLAATHLIERVPRWADGVLRLDRGRIAGNGVMAVARL